MGVKDLFPAFTLVLNYCRPSESNCLVYNVEDSTPKEPNLVMHYAEFNDEDMIGESKIFTISKQWVLENLDSILQSLPYTEEDETLQLVI
jgi:hypothetical protein